MKWELCATRTGMPTVKVIDGNKAYYLHSRYDPAQEATRWVDGQITGTVAPGYFVLVGMGAGYHANALHKKYPAVPIYAWDFNSAYGKWIEETGLLHWVRQGSNISYRVTESPEQIRSTLIPLIKNADSLLLIHRPSLDMIPGHLISIRHILEDMVLLKNSIKKSGHLLEENFRQNLALGDPGINPWYGKYVGCPMVLVSAGPSLTKQLGALKHIRENSPIIIGSVGTALIPLLKYGIKPDFVMVSDPQVGITEQINTLDNQDIPLFYLCTANARAVAAYRGPRYIVWQYGFYEAESQAAARYEPLITTGGSVATCLLDLMVQLGGSPIALVGQDLAYTGGRSHAAGTHSECYVNDRTTSIQVEDYFRQGKVSTARNLYSYLRWFEQYVRDRQNDDLFWNCTEGGAYINGWRHNSLKDFLDKISPAKK